MANAGRILIIPRGEYLSTIAYKPLDMVLYNNDSWLCKKEITGKEPSDANAEYWYRVTNVNDPIKAEALARQMADTQEAYERATADAQEASARESAIASEASARKTADDVLSARMDALTSLPEGSTTGDAELTDARVDFEGNTHGNVGEHIRNVSSKLSGENVEHLKTIYGEKRFETIIERGYHNISTGLAGGTNQNTLPRRAMHKIPILTKGNLLIILPTDYCCRVFFYKDGDFTHYTDWAKGVIIVKDSDLQSIQFTFAHTDIEKNLTDAEMSELQNTIFIASMDVSSDVTMSFELGTIGSSNAVNQDSATRIRTKDYILYKDAVVSVDKGYKYSLRFYDRNGTLLYSSDWLDVKLSLGVVAPINAYVYRIVLAKSDNSVINNVAEVASTFHIETNFVKKTARILGIGNSYTRDSLRWLWKILKESGYDDVVVGFGYWGGSTLEDQFNSLTETNENHTVFEYRKYTLSQNATTTAGVSLDTILKDEPWDIVVFQQQSDNAGRFESYVSDAFDINDFLNYVKGAIANNNLRVGLVAPWSHEDTYAGEKFVEWFDGDPEKQYKAIQEVTPRVANHMNQCDFFLNLGYAVELGRQNTYLGALGYAMLRSDKNHLEYGIPSFLAGMVYAVVLCGVKPSDFSWYPTVEDDGNIITETSAYLAYLAKLCALQASKNI